MDGWLHRQRAAARSRLSAGGLLDGPQKPAQYPHLALREPGPRDEALQPRGQQLGAFRLEIIDGLHRALGVLDEAGELGGGGERIVVPADGHRVTERLHAQLVSADLHGLCEIQGAEVRGSRDANGALAQRELLVGEPRLLAAEKNGDVCLRRLRGRPGGCYTRRHHGPFEMARAGGGAEHEPAVGDRRRDVVDHASRLQEIVCTRGACGRFRRWKEARPHQHELAQAHRLHRAGRRADVAGMRSLDQHHADAGEHGLRYARGLVDESGVMHWNGPRQSRLPVESRHSNEAAPAAAVAAARAPGVRAGAEIPLPMHPMLNIAVRAARRGATVILRNLERLDTLQIDLKGRRDYVSNVDREAETAIIDTLRNAYPDHEILAEESGSRGDSDFVWIIDPLDGTTNYLHGYPQVAVSIALAVRGEVQQAVVYDPLRDELFTATRGSGAQLNNRRLRVSRCRSLDHALLATGFPIRDEKLIEPYLKSFARFMHRADGVRRAGAAALDLAHVAAGRLDGFWEFGLHAWDIAAGALLVQEAGGMVGTPYPGQDLLKHGDIVAATPKVFTEIIEVLREFPVRKVGGVA